MMEKSALAGEGGVFTPTPFHSITIRYKVAVYAPPERADTLPLFHLYPIIMYSLTEITNVMKNAEIREKG